MRLIRQTPEVVAGLEKDLGAYPFSVIGGLTTSLDPRLRAREPDPADLPRGGRRYTSLVVHELAHQWFGDDIAVAGLARHLAQRGLRHLHGVALDRAHGGRPRARHPARLLRRHRRLRRFWKVDRRRPGRRPRSSTPPIYEPRRDDPAGAAQPHRRRELLEAPPHLAPAAARRQRRHARSSRSSPPGQRCRTSTAFFTAWLRTPAKPAETADNGLA